MRVSQAELELDGGAARRPVWVRLASRARSARSPRLLGPALRAAFAWAPVWVPALVLVQFAGLGLRAEWLESRRLSREEAVMNERLDRLLEARAALLLDAKKLGDPIYRERVQRSRHVAGRPPLTLAEDARAAAGRR